MSENETRYKLYVTYESDGGEITFAAADDDAAERRAKEKVIGWVLWRNWASPTITVEWFLRKPTEHGEGGYVRKGSEEIAIPSNQIADIQ